MSDCSDCGARVGDAHADGCDVARCLMTGLQRLSCEADHDHGSDTWTDLWPGDVECREFGWWAVFMPGIGWQSVPAGTPGAVEDLNRLSRDACWSPEQKRWVLLQQLGEWVSLTCGCVWRESRPPNVKISPYLPRACVIHKPEHPASVGASSQGMGLFMVVYCDRDPRQEAED